jgi:hypothetical protein
MCALLCIFSLCFRSARALSPFLLDNLHLTDNRWGLCGLLRCAELPLIHSTVTHGEKRFCAEVHNSRQPSIWKRRRAGCGIGALHGFAYRRFCRRFFLFRRIGDCQIERRQPLVGHSPQFDWPCAVTPASSVIGLKVTLRQSFFHLMAANPCRVLKALVLGIRFSNPTNRFDT